MKIVDSVMLRSIGGGARQAKDGTGRDSAHGRGTPSRGTGRDSAAGKSKGKGNSGNRGISCG
ncbi:hypothetical protein [Paludibacterium paludis]|uniref:Uncharacterized protein n=1 Tax=Paludibacterium paludis TaxID=1225769 RepID=A0A918P307_9NEIS|nr:hypothetical protein [Paludibacterium paludis]GGY17265.1 hypothetical protein GCM10011289_20810 [Paludibacterium paludis]